MPCIGYYDCCILRTFFLGLRPDENLITTFSLSYSKKSHLAEEDTYEK